MHSREVERDGGLPRAQAWVSEAAAWGPLAAADLVVGSDSRESLRWPGRAACLLPAQAWLKAGASLGCWWRRSRDLGRSSERRLAGGRHGGRVRSRPGGVVRWFLPCVFLGGSSGMDGCQEWRGQPSIWCRWILVALESEVGVGDVFLRPCRSWCWSARSWPCEGSEFHGGLAMMARCCGSGGVTPTVWPNLLIGMGDVRRFG